MINYLAALALIVLAWGSPAWAQSSSSTSHSAAQPGKPEVLDAMKRATTFMVEHVATKGGYVWAYLPDLSRRWGEIEARDTMVWVQPPGTPTMGHLFLDAYHATGDEYYYRAAEQAGDALIAGQLPAGGWNYVIDLAGDRSLQEWYDTIGRNAWRLEEFQHNWGNGTFDDGGTAESAKLLLRLHLEKRDARFKAALDKAIQYVLDSQYPVGAWPVIQDHVNGELLFTGTEFGLFFTVDGGRNWVQLKGGMPSAQVRDMTVQRRENDLVIATFGRGFYILDDYSALREMTPQALAEEARLFPLRDSYAFSQTGMNPAGSAGIGALAGNWIAPNPPFGAVFTYQLKQEPSADTKMVLTIADDAGKQIRRIELDKAAGLKRIAWNLRGDAPTPVAAPAGAPQGQRGAGGQAGAAAAGGPGGFGRGGAALVPPGRYTATLGKMVGDKVTAIGSLQTFRIVQIAQ